MLHACISLITCRKDRLKGHLVTTPECLREELHRHEQQQLYSQLNLKSSNYDSLHHHLKIPSQTTEIEEGRAEQAEQEEGGPEI